MLLTLHAHGQETKLSAVDSIRLKTGRKSVANLDIRVPIIKTLTKHMMENNDAFWNKPTDVPYLIAIALSFDSSGTVEDIFFSESLSAAKRQMLRLDSALFTTLKALDLHSFNHRDEVVMFPILFLDYHAKQMTLETGFIADYVNLWPQMNIRAKSKKLILLAPYYNRYGREIN